MRKYKTSVSNIFYKFLTDSGGLSDPGLGDSVSFSLTQEDRDRLVKQLHMAADYNRKFVSLLILLHIAILVGIAIGIWLLRGDHHFLIALLGGSGVGICYKILTSLREVWREVVVSEMAIAIIPNLPPQEAISSIEAVYFKLNGRD